MILHQAGDVFFTESSYEERSIPKAAGFRWLPFDGGRCRWQTKDRDVAARLAQYAAGEIAAQLLSHRSAAVQVREAAIVESRAADAPPAIAVPAPDGLSYLPYQLAGIACAMQRPATLIADEMGLGKTIQAIGVINADATVKNVLLVCPATLRLNWYRELRRWLTRQMVVQICSPRQRMVGQVCILNYDILTKLRERILERQWDLAILDECHLLKNQKAQRTVAMFGRRKRGNDDAMEPIEARRKVLLTGTPILNRPGEIWPLLHYLAPREWPSRYKFNADYGLWGNFCQPKNLDHLQMRLRSTVMIRRLKADVLRDLPPKRRQVVELDLDDKSRSLVGAESLAYERYERDMEEARIAAELAKAAGDDEYAKSVANLRYRARVGFTELAKLRHDTAVAKLPAVVEFVREALESSSKIVVFAHHHDVADGLMAAFGAEAVAVTGLTGMGDRQFAVDRFQTDAGCRVFVGSIKAAGVGITLTAASHVVFAELDWVPANVTQAEDRCHRIGQADTVLCQHLVLDGSLDARMAKVIVEKQEIADKALDRPPDGAIAEPDDPGAALVRSATQGVGRDKISEMAQAVTPALAAAVHRALRELAAVCDGARELDGAGFNRLDAGIGRALAGSESLTDRQAALGLLIVRKYRRQVPWFPAQ